MSRPFVIEPDGFAGNDRFRAKKDVAMTGKDAPPEVKIRSYQDSPICDVVVVVHGTEMVLRCPDYRQAMRWARLERKKYKFLSPISTLQPKLNPATCHFSCVEMEIDLCSARNVRKTGG